MSKGYPLVCRITLLTTLNFQLHSLLREPGTTYDFRVYVEVNANKQVRNNVCIIWPLYMTSWHVVILLYYSPRCSWSPKRVDRLTWLTLKKWLIEKPDLLDRFFFQLVRHHESIVCLFRVQAVNPCGKLAMINIYSLKSYDIILWNNDITILHDNVLQRLNPT